MAISVRPMNGNLLVTKDPMPEKIHEIILPEMNSIRPASGTVYRVASDLVHEYEPGTKVLFGKHAGQTFQVEDDKGEKLTVTSIHRSEVQAWIPAGVVVTE